MGPVPSDPVVGDGSKEDSADTIEPEPDARLLFANERTFLAWNRTALGLLVAGLAITQLLPPFHGIVGGRRIVGIPLIVLGGVLALHSWYRWRANEWALRRRQPLPRSAMPQILAMLIAIVAVVAIVLVLLSHEPRP